jgi:FtsZ-binding cell division protein ZapB
VRGVDSLHDLSIMLVRFCLALDIRRMLSMNDYASTIRKVEEDIEILQFEIKLKEFNIDHADVIKKRMVRQNEQEVARLQEEIENAQERIKAYKTQGGKRDG